MKRQEVESVVNEINRVFGLNQDFGDGYQKARLLMKDLANKTWSELQIGSVISFSVADFYAYYAVVEVGPKICKVIHVPVSEYTSPAANSDGEVWTESVLNHLLNPQYC